MPQMSLTELLAAVYAPNAQPDANGSARELLSSLDDSGVYAGKSAKPEDVLAFVDSLQANKLDAHAIESHLLSRTYAVGDELTAADIALFSTTAPRIVAASHSTRLETPATTRHFDHMQHQPFLIEALSRLGSPLASPTSIDVDNVPTVDRSAAISKKKDKPKKADAAAAAAAASSDATPAAPAKEGKKAKAAAAKADGPAAADKPAKAAKSGGGGGAAASAPAESSAPKPSMIDLRVGRIVDVKKHPDADSLYVEQIDVGEAEPRTVVSGLVKYVPIEEMQGKLLIAVCNLKPASMRGVKSFAMVLCASDKEHGKVEICDPPAGSQPGDRVYFEGLEDDTALDQLNPKKKQWEAIQPGFITLEGDRHCAWIDPADKSVVRKIVTSKGVVTAPSLVGASLS